MSDYPKTHQQMQVNLEAILLADMLPALLLKLHLRVDKLM